MKIRDNILLFIVFTSETPILKSIYAIFEKISLNCLVRALKKEPSLKSIYLRRSSAAGESIVGLSDIDIGVVIEPQKEEAAESKRSVYKQYTRFIRHFLGGYFDTNLAIYTTGEVNDLIFNVDVRGIIDVHLCYRLLEGIGGWRLLYGEKTLPEDIPHYTVLLRRIILFHELNNQLDGTNIIYRSFTPCEYPISKDKLSRIKLLYSIYKKTSDIVRLLVLFMYPDLPLTFSRKGSIELGVKHLGNLLCKENVDFLRRAQKIPGNLFKTEEIDSFFLQYKRFALRFCFLLKTSSDANPLTSYKKTVLGIWNIWNIKKTRIDIVRVCYPEFCDNNVLIEDISIAEVQCSKINTKEISEWLEQNTPVARQDMTINPCHDHSLSVGLKINTECSENKLREILEMTREFDKFYQRYIQTNILISISLQPTGDFSSMLGLELIMVTAFCLKGLQRRFTTSHPCLFLAQNDSLTFMYDKFWSLMLLYSKLWLLSNNAFSESLFRSTSSFAEQIMWIFNKYRLPEDLFAKLEAIYLKYTRYLDGNTCDQPTYSEFVSFLSNVEEYLKSKMEPVGNKENLWRIQS